MPKKPLLKAFGIGRTESLRKVTIKCNYLAKVLGKFSLDSDGMLDYI